MADDTLPTLEISNPLCAVCLEETDRDDGGWSCHDCGLQWDEDGDNPERTYAPDGQCRSTYTREIGGLSIETETFRCMKFAGHKVDRHDNPNVIASWKTGGKGVSEVAR